MNRANGYVNNKAFFKSPAMPTAHYMSGLALLATGKLDEAKPLLGAVVGVNIEGLPLGAAPEEGDLEEEGKINNMRIFLSTLVQLAVFFFSFSCGGEEEISTSETTDADKETQTPVEQPEKVVEEKPEPEPEPEPEELPDPNGVYLPSGEEKNGKPVYANGDGFFMWFNGSTWKITDKAGGGKTISTGQESINEKWSGGGKARHFPDEEYYKDAMFRLAVAYQGSQDNPNAIRLFEEYVAKFPDDKMVAEAYLSLGDLAISDVKPDEQPTFAQIESAQKNYNFVREKSQEMRLITDATFNEGGLLERVADNPEGVVDHYLSFDKNKDEVLQSSEYNSIGLNTVKSLSEFDLNGDKSLDYGELFDVASFVYYSNMESLFKSYSEKFLKVMKPVFRKLLRKLVLLVRCLEDHRICSICITRILRNMVMIQTMSG